MSKDMLGPVVRAAVGVPQEYMKVLAKIASALNLNAPNARALYGRLVSDLGWVAVKKELASNGLFSVRAMPVLADGTIVAVLSPTRAYTAVEGASAILGLTKNHDTDFVSLSSPLIERGYTLTWKQVGEMADQNDGVGGNSLLANGEDNCFFRETGDSANPVTISSIYHGQEWYSHGGAIKLSYDSCLMIRLDLNL